MIDDLVSVSLEDVLKEWNAENVEKLLKTFKCDLEPELEEFLVEDAILFHKKHRSRTYLFLSDDHAKVLAYVTLGIKCLRVPEENELSNKVKKEMNIHNGISQSYLIGQLCKANGVGRGIGPKMIDFSLRVFNQSFKSIGCRVVRADCKTDLIKFYEKNGFQKVSQDEDGELHHMIMML